MTSIHIEGAIFSPDLLGRLEDLPGQRPADFGLDRSARVKDEIARAWAGAQQDWRGFQRRLAALPADGPATRETRQQWVLPLLGRLGWQLEFQPRGAELNGQCYPLSHRAANRGGTVMHVVGWRDPAGLDRRPATRPGAPRLSAHALVQAYLNLSEELYGVVTNGRVLRLLRDGSRLVKLSYLEFDLERLFGDGLFADFALLFRLLHASRLPARREEGAQCWLERYHQDSLDAGARIRTGLSRAVEQALHGLANGFLQHPANAVLCQRLQSGVLDAGALYRQLLRLIYRLLFLMVIEERGLVFPAGTAQAQRDLYERHYSLQRLRRLSEQPHLAEPRHADLWLGLLCTFSLFESGGPGARLGLAPLAGELFGPGALGDLAGCTLGNDALLRALRALGLYAPPGGGPLVRVNYGALNVEEFGAVYEGLLEYAPSLLWQGTQPVFELQRGDARAHTGAHYTPDDLVQPLLKHSLEHLIAQRLQAPERAARAAALLALRVVDPACGSGHILLAAARCIATELAIQRTGEDQPAPGAYRQALRDVVRQCLYGVDLNPLAVELCKVALWLEAHVPGEPLSFLDHHIKCGNAIVGCVRREDVTARGIPNEVFTLQPGDDKAVAAALRRRNRAARQGQQALAFNSAAESGLDAAVRDWRRLEAMPDATPQQLHTKQAFFIEFTRSPALQWMKQLADLPIAQFYLAKHPECAEQAVTEAEYRPLLRGENQPHGPALQAAQAIAQRKRFFHWFIEFPEVMAHGGFDCVLGNPPYLGGQKLSGAYGHSFCAYVRWQFAPTGLSDLITFFLRRMHALLCRGGFMGCIATNSIKDGDVRRDGLEQLLKDGSEINYAARAIKWPGCASLIVSLVVMKKGCGANPKVLDGKVVARINEFLDEAMPESMPVWRRENAGWVFEGVKHGGEGFIVEREERDALIGKQSENHRVICDCLNGQELNRSPDQHSQRFIINFHDWSMEEAQHYAEPFSRVERLVKPVRDHDNRLAYRQRWWQYVERRRHLSEKLNKLQYVFAAAVTTKYLNFSRLPAECVFLSTIDIFATDRWDLYAVVQSSLHEIWARKYSGTLKQDLRYSPSKCFETFPFPEGLWQKQNAALAAIGEQYHEHRRGLMRRLWLGLTPVYNLFHAGALDPALVAKLSGKAPDMAESGFEGLLKLRRLHAELDHAVRDAYGWHDLALNHGFVEVETLPEQDRVRFTLAPAARRETLRRLLALNHERAATEDSTLTARPGDDTRKGPRHAAGNDGHTAALFGGS